MNTRTLLLRILLAGVVFFIVACNGNKPVPRVGILIYGDSRLPQVEGFMQGMSEYGYIPGKTIQYFQTSAENQPNKLFSLAVQMLKQNPDVLVAGGGLEADAMKQALSGMTTPPVVILQIGSLIERGLVNDPLHPEWAVTGVDNLNVELSAKRIELIRQLNPEVKNIMMFRTPEAQPGMQGVAVAESRARQLGLKVHAKDVYTPADINHVMTTLKPGEMDFLLTVTTPLVNEALKDIILPRAAQIGLPVFVQSRGWGELGAVASFGAPYFNLGVQAARLADKVLKGTPAAEIPFETPANFSFLINPDLLNQYGLVMSPEVQAIVDGTLGKDQ